nr:hypothetical protein [Saccharopolyspora erythraea]
MRGRRPHVAGSDPAVGEHHSQRFVGLRGVGQDRGHARRVEVGHQQLVLHGEHVGVAGPGVGAHDPGAARVTEEGDATRTLERAAGCRGRGRVGGHRRLVHAAVRAEVHDVGQQLGRGVGDAGDGRAAQAVPDQHHRTVLGGPAHHAERVVGVVVQRQRGQR